MSAGVQHPHDKLFRTVFADTEEAALFLRAHLPAALSERIDWSTLTLQETSLSMRRCVRASPTCSTPCR